MEWAPLINSKQEAENGRGELWHAVLLGILSFPARVAWAQVSPSPCHRLAGARQHQVHGGCGIAAIVIIATNAKTMGLMRKREDDAVHLAAQIADAPLRDRGVGETASDGVRGYPNVGQQACARPDARTSSICETSAGCSPYCYGKRQPSFWAPTIYTTRLPSPQLTRRRLVQFGDGETKNVLVAYRDLAPRA